MTHDVRRRDELLPRLPRVPDRVPGGRELRGAVRDGAQRHRASQRRRLRAQRTFWRAVTLGFLFMRPRALRAGRTADARLSAQRARGPGAAFGLTRLLPPTLRAARAAGAAHRRRVLESADRAQRDAARSDAVSRRAADRLHPGPRLLRRQPRHRRRAARQRLRRRHAAAAAVLRLAARAQRRARPRARAGAADDRSVAARSLRRDHHQRRRLRLAPAPLRSPARRRSALRDAGERVGRARCATSTSGWSQIGCRAPAAAPFDEPVDASPITSRVISCTGRRSRGQPRALLRLLPGVSLVELPESSWCCGSAGIYALTQPAQADALLQRKVEHIASTAATTLVATANPGCHLQIARGLRGRGRRRAGRASGVAARARVPAERDAEIELKTVDCRLKTEEGSAR